MHSPHTFEIVFEILRQIEHGVRHHGATGASGPPDFSDGANNAFGPPKFWMPFNIDILENT